MGVVFLGEHQLIGKHVAVKVLHPELSKDRQATARFFTEARAAASLDHPNLAAVFDFGYGDDGQAFLVMELLHGEPLSQLIQRHPRLDPGSAVWIARQIALGLGVAHDSGIAHRDLKPENVFVNMITGSDEALIKVVDFGIAKLAEPGILTGSPERTKTGVLLGTPLYMSPEQCRGSNQVDHRTDIYSLGCILFTAVCGRSPFQYDAPGELIAAHLHEEPPGPRTLMPTIPIELDALILRMLRKNPDERPQSMAEVVSALDAIPIRAAFDPALLEGSHRTRPLHATTPFSHGSTPQPVVQSMPDRTQVLPQTGIPVVSASETQKIPVPTLVAASQEEKSPTTLGAFTGETSPPKVDERSIPARLRALREGMKVVTGLPVAARVGAAAILIVLLGGTVLWRLQARERPGGSRERESEPLARANAHAAGPLFTGGRAAATAPPATPAPAPVTRPAIAIDPRPGPAPDTARPRARDEAARRAPREKDATARQAGKTEQRAKRAVSVRVTVASPPAGLAARLDGRAVKLPLRLPKDDRVHKLELKANGKRKLTMELRADTDQVLKPAWRPEVVP